MEIFVPQLINGISLGSIYGLIAIGYTMVFCIRRAPSQPRR
jgi:branched-subunit amino acid ABC-type transport system permease component